MKIDRSKGKKSSTEAPPEAKALIGRLKDCQSTDDLLAVIKSIKTWTFGKCELYHWVDVLDRFDGILAEAAEKQNPESWILACDHEGNKHLKECVLHVLRFTTMLVEHSFSRHLYNSIEHLINLLISTDLELVLEVLHLLYMFSKRSNYLTRMSGTLRTHLNKRLTYLAESWGGKEAGFGLADCCQDYTLSSYPSSATSVHLEYTNLQAKPARGKADAPCILHIDNVHTLGKNAGQLMDEITSEHNIPPPKMLLLFIHLRLATNFAFWNTRILCVQARLQALSVLIYANGISDNTYQLLYRGFLEELVDVLELEDPRFTEIKAAALRTLTSIIHLDRAQHFPKYDACFSLPKIIDVTEVGSYHGFLPMMVRSCIGALTSSSGKSSENFPLPLATALFSFVYHLASYEQGSEALVTCGMLESLIKVINWNTVDPEQITFVTRAVRVIDLITNLDMHAFQSHNGLTVFINRLEMEITECRKEQPYEIRHEESHGVNEDTTNIDAESDPSKVSDSNGSPMDTDSNNERSNESAQASTSDASEASKYFLPANEYLNKGLTCLPQRAALLKSMLNFLKKAIQDVAFADSIRHIMETSLPTSLKHIISNAEYYGSSLFLLATDVVTVYVFQEPSLLSSLQDSGLTDVMLDAILTKELPPTREVISSIPNVFSALSLNTRGLNAFVKRKPFHRIFRVLITPEYLPPMRRRRTAESLGDTASNLGSAMDELMRHQPSLKTEAMKALVELLQELCSMGRDAKYSCWKPQSKVVVTVVNNNNRAGTSEGGSSDDDDDEDEEGVLGINPNTARSSREDTTQAGSEPTVPTEEKPAVPLVDYILNVMKFVEAILSNNSTDDHCREFVNQKGLEPLLEVLSIPNLPLDFPTSPACQAATSVCKSILNLAHEGRVLSEGMTGLENLLKRLKPLNEPLDEPGSSVLLHELANAGIPPELVGNPQDTPILNAMTATHAHIMMFIHVCRTGQNDIRGMSISMWGSAAGLKILKQLSELYWNLIWESSVLLALCSGEFEPGPNEFARADLDKMFPPESKNTLEVSLKDAVEVTNFTSEMQIPTTSSAEVGELMDLDTYPSADGESSQSAEPAQTSEPTQSTKSKTAEAKGAKGTTSQYGKLLRPILSSSSRLGRALAELFGLLVKLSVGSPIRQRRSNHHLPAIPGFVSPASCAVSKVLAELLIDGLSWEPVSPTPVPRLSFKICAVGFSAPLLLDEKKFPYHLMLKMFCDVEGIKALFQVFYNALQEGQLQPSDMNEENNVPSLSEKEVEFLEAWLSLVEKLVNPTSNLESPHVLSAKAPSVPKSVLQFEPSTFLGLVHKMAFDAVMLLWNSRSMASLGTKGAESMLGIFCHILRHTHQLRSPPSPKSGTATTQIILNGPTIQETGSILRSNRQLDNYAISEGRRILQPLFGQRISNQPVTSSPNTNSAEAPEVNIADTNTTGPEEAAVGTPAATADASLDDLPPLEVIPVAGATGEASTSNAEGNISEQANPDSRTLSPRYRSAAAAMNVNISQLQQLVDMGFPVEGAMEALVATHGLLEATEYLLNNGSTVMPESGNGNETPRAPTTRSLAQTVMDWATLGNDGAEVLQGMTVQLEDGTTRLQHLPPGCTLNQCLCAEDLNSATESILEKCIAITDDLPDTVFKVCELLVAVATRKGKPWLKNSLSHLVTEIEQLLKEMHQLILNVKKRNQTLEFVSKHDCSQRLYIRLHLFALMFDEAHLNCALLMDEKDIVSLAISEIRHLQELMAWQTEKSGEKTIPSCTPKWLSPLILALDLYQKSATANNRRRKLAMETDHVWKWFDINSGKWCPYSAPNNHIIDTAFWNGENSVRITAGRRRYVINFSGMIQLNEETSNRRPITLWLKSSRDLKGGASNPVPRSKEFQSSETQDLFTVGDVINNLGIGLSDNEQFNSTKKQTQSTGSHTDKMDVEFFNVSVSEYDTSRFPFVEGLSNDQAADLIRCSVTFLRLVPSDTLHSVMRLCLRLTRNFEMASKFSDMGGVRTLLDISDDSAFPGFLPLANLLIRHAMEDRTCLRFAMEKMIRAKAMSTGASTCKELHYLLRVLAPVACREPNVFTDVAEDILRVDINFVTRRGLSADDDMRLIIKPTPCKFENLKASMTESSKQVIHDLLMALPNHPQHDEEDEQKKFENKMAALMELACGGRTQRQIPPRRIVLEDDVNQEEGTEQMDTDSPKQPTDKDTEKTAKDSFKNFLITKLAIFQLLAESVHSYSYSSKVIAEFTFQAQKTPGMTEDTTALAYMLDTSLTSCDTTGKDGAKVVMDLISGMAACNHIPEVQTIIISEIKGALQRAVALRESPAKHARITALSSLLGQMIESCPSSPSTQLLGNAKPVPSMNPILKLVLKKGLMADLTRIPHHLDLTSSELCGTLNSLLSTLEIISRIVNQPVNVNPSRPKPRSEVNPFESILAQDTSNSAGTRAQGEETVEDADNTEHDVSAGAESLDPTSENHQALLEDSDDAFVDAMTNNLFATITNQVNEQIRNGENMNDLLRSPNRMDTEQDEANDSSDSESESEGSVEAEEEEQNEDDDDDEDEDDEDDEDESEEDEEDEDAGSNFNLENEQSLMDEGFIRFPGLEREEDMLMVQYGDLQDENTPMFFTNNTSYNFNLGLFEDPLSNEGSVTGLRMNHPLLSTPVVSDQPESRAITRTRNNRARRYQYFQYINPRHPHPPAILQRLLGPSTAQEVMQLTTGQGLPHSLRDTRFVVQVDDPPMQISSLPREGAARTDSIANFTALHWWCEESRALDGESMHDCVVGIKRRIVEAVESDRDQVFKSREEKRRKEQEENKKKPKDPTENSSLGTDLVALARRMPELAMAALGMNSQESGASSVPTLFSPEGFGDDDDDDSESGLSDLPDLEEIPSRSAQARLGSASDARILSGLGLGLDRDLAEINRLLYSGPNLDAAANVAEGLNFDADSNGFENMITNESPASAEAQRVVPPPEPVAATPEASEPNSSENKIENTDEAAASTGQPQDPVAGPSGVQSEDFRNILGDIEVPEGVDPSFLAALPEDMRREVIAEHLRQQRLRQPPRAQPVASEAAPAVGMELELEVSPEFLAALPPNIQEELLAQQRLEQQRRIAVASNPNDPVDTEAFFRNLQPSLRQSILADMEESQIAVLPPELAAEAQNLRREFETRNRQLLQDRFIHGSNAATSATFTSILRNSGLVAGMRHMSSRYALQSAVRDRGTTPGRGWRNWGSGPSAAGPSTSTQAAANASRVKGKQLVDHETLCCILIILYIEDPKINNGRLHRVLRNLSYHAGTRNWIIKALLSVLEKGNDCTIPLPAPVSETAIEPAKPSVRRSSRNSTMTLRQFTASNEKKRQENLPLLQTVNPSWLNVTLESAMGCRANVFHIQKAVTTGRKSGTDQRQISLHPQAVPSMCKNTMDMLCNLAKSFPCHFLPGKHKSSVEWTNDSTKISNSDGEGKGRSSSTSSGKSKPLDSGDSFFDLLLKLDAATTSKKGKSAARVHSATSLSQDLPVAPTSFEESHFGKLISMLGYPFIRRSSLLTDKLLRILSMISLGIPDTNGYGRKVVLEEPTNSDYIQVPESHLRLIVEVITAKSCSEEGLEEATSLLLNLSFGPPSTRDKILKLLTEGVRKLGIVVCEHIASLMSELRSLNKDGTKETSDDSASSEVESPDKKIKGAVLDRFTKESVIITSKSKGKPTSELQLPTMLALTSKSSSQAFFLRLLKVIISLREAIRAAIKKHKQDSTAIGGPIMSSTRINGTNEPSATGTSTTREDQPMDVDQDTMDTTESPQAPPAETDSNTSDTKAKKSVGSENKETSKSSINVNQLLPRLSEILDLDTLWATLSECLLELGHTPDHHAVLVLQPAVEAFFLVHASTVDKDSKKVKVRETREAQLAHLQQDLPPVSPVAPADGNTLQENESSAQLATSSQSQPITNLSADAQSFVKFAETHRTVLNQILRQSTSHLADGPFAVLVDHTRVLDFDVKRRYFRTELERLDEGVRREDLAVHVRRSHVFEDSVRELQRHSAENWKNRFYIVFEGEEGQDAGGLLREWYMIISREIFNPMYALFTVSPGDRVTYMINPSSHCNPNHLFYFKFVGRVIAKAIYDNKLLECYFTRSFYKHILGKHVKHVDMESEDYSFYQGLAYLMDNNVSELGYDLTFSTEVQEFGVTEVRDLITNGRNIAVTEENKMEYIRLVCQMKMTGAIRKQLNAFLEGFYDIIPKRLISIFSEQELELLVSGLPNIDIEDLKANTEYHKYQPTSLQIQWFWRALRSFDQADRAKFLQFVTGTSKVPLQGFGALEGMNGVQKFQIHRDDRSTDRLPSAHTCFNQLDLPAYETYDKLRSYMLKAIHECSEGFGFA